MPNFKVLHKEPVREKRIVSVINDYATYSSLHGVKYISKRNAHIHDRLSWFIMFLASVIISCAVGHRLWMKYQMVPTVISVKETHQPLYTVPFPTISVCPSIKVKKTLGKEILSKYLHPLNRTREEAIEHILSVFSLMQFPSYYRMKYHLRESKNYHSYFYDLNITNFMHETMPKCWEIFKKCYWHGQYVNCCRIFNVQHTEEGYCYSYNSLTSENTIQCSLIEVLENEGVIDDTGVITKNCSLRRNTGMGTGSGLELYLKPSNPNDNLGPSGQRDINGVSIMVHNSYEFPDAGTGAFISNAPGARLSIAISPEITMSSDSIRGLDTETRGCIFPDEQPLKIHHVYTDSSCLIECRLKHIVLMCKCKIYFFVTPRDIFPPCGLRHLLCLVKHSAKFYSYRPPIGTPGITERELMESMNCHCMPTCHDTVFEVKLDRSKNRDPESGIGHAYVDIFYENTGFVRYQRYIVFGWNDLLVSLGGVANLFLGFSLLSVVELIYWLYKLVDVVIRTHMKRKVVRVHPAQQWFLQ